MPIAKAKGGLHCPLLLISEMPIPNLQLPVLYSEQNDKDVPSAPNCQTRGRQEIYL